MIGDLKFGPGGGGGSGGSSLPVDQATAVVKGTSDPTKTFKIDIDTNGTAGAARTVKAPAADGTIITDVDRFFSPSSITVQVNGGSITGTSRILFTKACTITHYRLYYPDTTSRTLKLSIFNNGGTTATTQDQAYNTVGVKNTALSSPLSVAAYTRLYIGMWDKAGGAYFGCDLTAVMTPQAGEIPMFPMGPALFYNGAYYKAGDGFPDTFYGAGNAFPIEPVITVP